MPFEIFVTQRINAENISSIVGNINYSNKKEIIFFCIDVIFLVITHFFLSPLIYST